MTMPPKDKEEKRSCSNCGGELSYFEDETCDDCLEEEERELEENE